jgi:hypothetical protein
VRLARGEQLEAHAASAQLRVDAAADAVFGAPGH